MSKREPLGHFASSLNLPEQHFFALPYNFNMHMHVKQSGTGLDTKSTILRVSVCVCVWGGGELPQAEFKPTTSWSQAQNTGTY